MRILDRALAQLPTDKCVEWEGYHDPDGYGRWADAWGGSGTAHRRIYTLVVGPIPEGLEIDHLCRNRGCVNPAHLEPVTTRENARRAAPAQKTSCIRGHPYDEANTYIRHPKHWGRRDCRACMRERFRRYRQRKKEGAA